MKKFKIDLIIPLSIILFFLISIISIYSASSILSKSFINLYKKQMTWYIIGSIIFIFILFLKNEVLNKYSLYIYLLSIILLILVLFIGEDVNNSKAWINIGIFNIEPSEIAKIGLIIYLSNIFNNYKKKKDLNLILKSFIITLIPSILTFIEPDTGSVISYFTILITMIFIHQINKKKKILITILSLILIISFICFYIYFPNKFIEIFGSNFYYRIFRITDWINEGGMQLKNSLAAISTSGLFGYGFNNTPIYFPEPQTDFIFAVFTSNFGLVGAISLILSIIIFDSRIITIGIKNQKKLNKYLTAGIIAYFIYPQIQNIAMTISLLPITGVPLPFISYGGSGIIVSFILTALSLNIYKEKNA